MKFANFSSGIVVRSKHSGVVVSLRVCVAISQLLFVSRALATTFFFG